MMSKMMNDKICMVCGDKALGHNFNAVTCESCKAFFRRNAISNKKFSCPFSNACEITIITRRFCQKCRLEKCFKIGMKKEYIMSEEDKEIKRLKIEHNRNKRKLKTGTEKASSDDETEQSMTKRSVRVKEEWSPGSTSSPVSTAVETQSESSMNIDSYEFQRKDPSQNISSNSSADELIEAIMQEPKEAGKVIQKVMKSKREALVVMSKIIQEPSQALILISHLIKNPSDGMIIISKMMSSPLDALSVFAQFMSSPTDALQLIFKIMSSPGSVLQFMTELTETPQKALEIMKRFMSSTNDTLTGLNQIMTSQSESSDQSDHQNEMIKSMLEVSSVDSPNSSVASPSSAFQSIRVPDSPQSLTTSYGSDFDNNNNNNDYRHNTESLLNEISHDISRKQSPFNGNSIDSIINEAIKLEYETPEMVNQIRSPHHRELSEIEILKIQELIDSNKALYAPVDDDLVSFDTDNCQIKAETGLDPTLLNVINLTAIAIRRLIKMSKKISGFKKMCQEDQIALLKGGCTEMMILRSVMQYDSDHAFWKIPHTLNSANIRTDILKLCPKGNIYEEHENFIKTFDPKLRTDENIVLILCAITLFCPDRQGVIHSDVIKLEQNSYYFLLRRYLESIYEGCEARSVFLQLLQKIQEVRKLNEEVISVYLDVNPSQVEPLLREIFDLKV